MMGGTAAPAWMRGQALPGFMMGTTGDPGKVMGSLFGAAATPRRREHGWIPLSRHGRLTRPLAGPGLPRAGQSCTFYMEST
jgi:hypothetical protein